jgi:glycosyltransferase involved in cell wall biosynthesis
VNILSVATFALPEFPGGAERVLSETAARLAARGHAVTLLTARVGNARASERRDGVRILRYPAERGNPVRFQHSVWRGVRDRIERLEAPGPDVVHLHQFSSALAALASPRLARVPRLFSFYAPYHLEWLAGRLDGRPDLPASPGLHLASALIRVGDRRLVRACDGLHVLSRFSLGQACALDASARGRARIIPPGVDLERFRPARDAAERAAERSALGLPADGLPLLVTVRRLVRRMGLGDLVEAIRLLRGDGVPVRLAVAGQGSEAGALERQARSAGVGDLVHWPGRVAESALPGFYRAADVFVLPTRSLEGFGMATAEALASGLPIVATDAGATPELLAGAAGSSLVPAARPRALARAIAAVVADPAARAAAAGASRGHAERVLRWDTSVAAIETLLASLVTASRPARA